MIKKEKKEKVETLLLEHLYLEETGLLFSAAHSSYHQSTLNRMTVFYMPGETSLPSALLLGCQPPAYGA
jgi:hypothetical protein